MTAERRFGERDLVITPFLGRGELFAEALTALQHRRIVALFGAEGMGKTRLALELAQAVAPASAKRAVARGSIELERFPFAPMLHLLRNDLDLSNPIVALRSATDDLLSQPIVVLVVDDYHLLDPSTTALVHSVATTAGPRLILTARTREVPDTFRRLERDNHAFVAELSPLDDTATRALCAAVAGTGLAPRAEARLLTLARGNPLLAVELTRRALGAGVLVPSGALLELRGTLPAAELRDLVAGELGTLSRVDRRAMELLALADHLDAPTLVRLVGSNTVLRLQERNLVSERTEHRNRLDTQLLSIGHPLYTESLLADLPAFRRSMLLVDLADAISQHDPPHVDDAARQALWLHGAGHDISSSNLAGAASGLTAASLRSLVRAAEATSTTSDTHERNDSSRLLASAIRDRYADVVRLAELAYGADPTYANALLFMRSTVSSNHALDRAAALIDEWSARPLTPDEDLGIRRAARLVHGYHRQDFDRARAIVGRKPWPTHLHAAVRIELASIELNAGKVNEAGDALAAERRRDDLDPLTRVLAALELSIVRTSQGRALDTIELVDEHFPLAVANGGEPAMVSSLWWMRAVAAAFEGNFTDAESMLLSTFNSAVAGDSVEGAGFFADGLALVARTQGRYRTAVRRARQAVDLLGVRDVGHRAHAMGELALALCAAGDATGARKALDLLASHHNLRPSARPMLPLARCHVAALEGRSASETELDQAWEQIGTGGAQSLVVLVWIAATTGRAAWAATRTGELRGIVQGGLNVLQLDAIDSIATADLPTIRANLNTARLLDAHGVSLALADAGCQHVRNSANQPERSSWELELEHARRATEGARSWSDSARSPAVALSRREFHIVRLAQSGLADAAIAAQLALSVRTVESHLTRAYAKLGVRGRRDLVSITLDRTGV